MHVCVLLHSTRANTLTMVLTQNTHIHTLPYVQEIAQYEQQRQQQQLIASENDDDVMRGAVQAAEAAALGSLDAEDPSAVIDVSVIHRNMVIHVSVTCRRRSVVCSLWLLM